MSGKYKKLLECIKTATIKAIEFLDNNWATYKPNRVLEKKYSEYGNKADKRMSELKARFKQ